MQVPLHTEATQPDPILFGTLRMIADLGAWDELALHLRRNQDAVSSRRNPREVLMFYWFVLRLWQARRRAARSRVAGAVVSVVAAPADAAGPGMAWTRPAQQEPDDVQPRSMDFMRATLMGLGVGQGAAAQAA